MTRESKQQRLRALRDAKIAAKIATKSEALAAPTTPAVRPTFGEVVGGSLDGLSQLGRKLVSEATRHADETAKAHLRVISCHTCTAPKGCCKMHVAAMLHEGVPIASRLRREGRDTPALRDELLAAATAMERTRLGAYFRPCVFLTADERCSVYEDRAFECGAAFVMSPPELCSKLDATSGTDAPDLQQLAPVREQAEERFVRDAGLIREGFPYVGVLPRVVLLCLQAWDRRDYPRFLAEGGREAAVAYRELMNTDR